MDKRKQKPKERLIKYSLTQKWAHTLIWLILGVFILGVLSVFTGSNRMLDACMGAVIMGVFALGSFAEEVL